MAVLKLDIERLEERIAPSLISVDIECDVNFGEKEKGGEKCEKEKAHQSREKEKDSCDREKEKEKEKAHHSREKEKDCSPQIPKLPVLGRLF